MDRDMRLTGVFRGQSDAVQAPAGFEGMLPAVCAQQSLTSRPVNSRWKVSDAEADQSRSLLTLDRPSPRFFELVQATKGIFTVCHMCRS